MNIHTHISNHFLQTMLANSISLTPGTITLDLNNNALSVLYLFDSSQDRETAQKPVEETKCKLERILVKMEK